MNGPNRECYQFYESFERNRTCSVPRPIVPSVPHHVLTVVSLEGIARNMPEICVWQLAFDIQSCRASLTKRVTNTHTHTHTYVYTHTPKYKHTPKYTLSHTHTLKKEDIWPVFNLFVIMFAHFLMLPFLYPVESCLKWGIPFFMHECINNSLFYIFLMSITAL